MSQADPSRTDHGNIDRLRGTVRAGVSKLKGLDMGDELGIEVLSQLVDGKRTVAEMVEQAYGLQVTDEGFHSAYSKVRREVRRLESRGLVSRKLLGRNKPYRLTRHAIINLASIGGEEQQQSILAKADLAAYLTTTALAVPTASHAVGWLQLGEAAAIGIFGCFCFLLGISAYGSARAIRRVM